jgi:hypothetical protein
MQFPDLCLSSPHLLHSCHNTTHNQLVHSRKTHAATRSLPSAFYIPATVGGELRLLLLLLLLLLLPHILTPLHLSSTSILCA